MACSKPSHHPDPVSEVEEQGEFPFDKSLFAAWPGKRQGKTRLCDLLERSAARPRPTLPEIAELTDTLTQGKLVQPPADLGNTCEAIVTEAVVKEPEDFACEATALAKTCEAFETEADAKKSEDIPGEVPGRKWPKERELGKFCRQVLQAHTCQVGDTNLHTLSFEVGKLLLLQTVSEMGWLWASGEKIGSEGWVNPNLVQAAYSLRMDRADSSLPSAANHIFFDWDGPLGTVSDATPSNKMSLIPALHKDEVFTVLQQLQVTGLSRIARHNGETGYINSDLIISYTSDEVAAVWKYRRDERKYMETNGPNADYNIYLKENERQDYVEKLLMWEMGAIDGPLPLPNEMPIPPPCGDGLVGDGPL